MLLALVVTLATMMAVAANARVASTAVMITVSVVIPRSSRQSMVLALRDHHHTCRKTWGCSTTGPFGRDMRSEGQDVGQRGPTDEQQEGDEEQHDGHGH